MGMFLDKLKFSAASELSQLIRYRLTRITPNVILLQKLPANFQILAQSLKLQSHQSSAYLTIL